MPATPASDDVGGFCIAEEVGMHQSCVSAPDGVKSLLTADEAAELCGVTVITVRGWANRGYLTHAGDRVKLPVSGRNRQGRNVYQWLDVAKAERATRERARRDHTPR